jgi:hypothetical protein
MVRREACIGMSAHRFKRILLTCRQDPFGILLISEWILPRAVCLATTVNGILKPRDQDPVGDCCVYDRAPGCLLACSQGVLWGPPWGGPWGLPWGSLGGSLGGFLWGPRSPQGSPRGPPGDGTESTGTGPESILDRSGCFGVPHCQT